MISHSKSVIFVAILDSAGRIIIGHEKGQWPEWPERETGGNNKALFQSVDFYRNILLPTIQCMQDRNRRGCEIIDGDFKVAALRIADNMSQAGYYIFAIEERV